MKNKSINTKCPTCGAPITFSPTSKKWECEYCENKYTLEELQKYNNASNEKHNTTEDEYNNYSTYLCKECGAEIIADEHTTATFCLYCGNTAILKNKLSGEFRPKKIIPFSIEKDCTISAFKNLSKRFPLMPKEFNNEKNIEKITGVYIPFWLYNVLVSGGIDAKGTKITSWSRGNTRYTKTDIYQLIRDGSMNFEKIPVDGSSKFDNSIMNSIEPFNYQELIDYNHAYLSGFLAEKYDVDSESADDIAIERALNSAKNQMLDDMGSYSTKTIVSNSLKSDEATSEYVLLPVWMVNVKYKNEYYIFAMNGQTGKFIGNIPLDKNKAIRYFIFIFLGVFALVILISYLIYLGGNL